VTGTVADDAAVPRIQVVSGRPDDVELAAVVAVLLARAAVRAGTGGPGAAAAPGTWGAPSTLVRQVPPVSWGVALGPRPGAATFPG